MLKIINEHLNFLFIDYIISAKSYSINCIAYIYNTNKKPWYINIKNQVLKNYYLMSHENPSYMIYVQNKYKIKLNVLLNLYYRF